VGAQAIAAMAFGTQSIPKVDKIFGPGNAWVTKAKQMLGQEYLEDVSFDLPAGPSEVLILGDEFSNPKFIASDLLAQAEHGNESQVILITTSEKLLNSVKIEIESQIQFLSRSLIIKKSLEKSALILLENINQCIEFINQYASEHLILQNKNPRNILSKILNAGAIFIGNYTPESIGDYISGSNHVLPTNGFAKNYSGLSVNDFVKYISVQNLTERGLRQYGKNVEILSNIEGLTAHKNSITIRLKELDNNI
jgi:histidinol dehydrogenase